VSIETTKEEREVALPALILLLEAWEGSAEVSFVKRLGRDVDTLVTALGETEQRMDAWAMNLDVWYDEDTDDGRKLNGLTQAMVAQATKARAVLGSDVSEN
jgi:hypothetical protein